MPQETSREIDELLAALGPSWERLQAWRQAVDFSIHELQLAMDTLGSRLDDIEEELQALKANSC